MAETTSDLQTDEEQAMENAKEDLRFATWCQILTVIALHQSAIEIQSFPSHHQPLLPPPAPLPPPIPLPRRNLFPDSPSTSQIQTFPTPHSKRVDEKMLQLLEEIWNQNETSQRLLTLILRKLSSSPSVNNDVLPDKIKFPLETPQELAALEEKLADQTVKQKVVMSIQLGDAVRRIMKYVLGHALSTMYNWVGKGGKKAAFSSLLMKDVMIRAVRKNMPSATNAELEPVIKDWFRYAKDRQGGRNERIK